MGYEPNYSSRYFSRRTKVQAFNCARDEDGVPRCSCTAPLRTGHIHYDHIIPWEICGYSGPSNCQVLCTTCHLIKTGEVDVPQIADNNRMRDAHINASPRPRHPMPAGRGSRWSKPLGGGPPVERLTQSQKLAIVLERRQILTQRAEA